MIPDAANGDRRLAGVVGIYLAGFAGRAAVALLPRFRDSPQDELALA